MSKKTSVSGAIAYARVSTNRQGEQGIGLAAQRAAIDAYAAQAGIEIVAFFEDVGSGRGDNNLEARSGLLEAIYLAESSGLEILIYSFSRLTRQKETARRILQDHQVVIRSVSEGACLDLAVVESLSARAEYEGNEIAQRTKKAMADLKAKGVKFGNPKLEDARAVAVDVIRQAVAGKAKEIADSIRENDLHNLTRRELADALNGIGSRTRRNQPWTAERLRDPLKAARQLLQKDEDERLVGHPLFGRF